MKATTEMEIKITGGRIIGADLSVDGVCKLTVEAEFETEQKPKDIPSDTPDKTPETERTGGYGPGMSAFWDDEWDRTGCCGD